MADIIKTTDTFEINIDYDLNQAVDEGFSNSRKLSVPIKVNSDESGAAISARWSTFVDNTYNSSSTDDAKFKPFWRLLFQPNGWLDSPDSTEEAERPITVDEISASYTQKKIREFEQVVSWE